MNLKEKLWNSDAERGVIWGLIAGTILMGIIGHIDPATKYDLANGASLPYSIFWTWISPFWGNDQPYMFILMLQSLAIYALQWKLVKIGRIPRNLFVMNLAVNTIWMAWSTPQYVLQTIFAPFGAINPIVLPLEFIMKLPLGWSWNLKDGHWLCGVYGQCVGYNPGNRFVGLSPSNWAHFFQVVMWIIPVIVWIQKRRAKK